MSRTNKPTVKSLLVVAALVAAFAGIAACGGVTNSLKASPAYPNRIATCVEAVDSEVSSVLESTNYAMPSSPSLLVTNYALNAIKQADAEGNVSQLSSAYITSQCSGTFGPALQRPPSLSARDGCITDVLAEVGDPGEGVATPVLLSTWEEHVTTLFTSRWPGGFSNTPDGPAQLQFVQEACGTSTPTTSQPTRTTFPTTSTTKRTTTTTPVGYWNEPVTVDSGSPFGLAGISCASESFCIGVDANGDFTRFNGRTWSAPKSIGAFAPPGAASGDGPSAISCPSPTFCVGIDEFAGWGLSNHAFIYNGSSWSESVATTHMLTSVSCPNRQFCMVGDADGDIELFNGTSWTRPASLGKGEITPVSCGSPTFCGAVDSSDNAYVYYVGKWSTADHIDRSDAGFGLVSISCTDVWSCMAVDAEGNAYGYFAGKWGVGGLIAPNGGGLTSIYCGSSYNCLVGDSNGQVIAYEDGYWGTPEALLDSGVSAVDCAGTTFCVAASDQGQVVTVKLRGAPASSVTSTTTQSVTTTTFPTSPALLFSGGLTGLEHAISKAFASGQIPDSAAMADVTVTCGSAALKLKPGVVIACGIATPPGDDAEMFVQIAGHSGNEYIPLMEGSAFPCEILDPAELSAIRANQPQDCPE